MIEKYRHQDLVVYVKSDGEKYKEILEDVLKYRINTVKVLRNIDDTKVSLIDTKYGKYVLKIFAPKQKKTERFLKSFVRGDYYKNLIVQTDRVRELGNTFPNDFYLLAERKIFNYASVFIMLIEYVEGVELNDIDEVSLEIKKEIKSKIELLHQQKMLSGDPHKGNFILSKDGIRAIDLSGKKCTSQLRAKDRLAMERHLGIKNEIFDFGYYLVIYKLKIRNLIKKMKGKS